MTQLNASVLQLRLGLGLGLKFGYSSIDWDILYLLNTFLRYRQFKSVSDGHSPKLLYKSIVQPSLRLQRYLEFISVSRFLIPYCYSTVIDAVMMSSLMTLRQRCTQQCQVRPIRRCSVLMLCCASTWLRCTESPIPSEELWAKFRARREYSPWNIEQYSGQILINIRHIFCPQNVIDIGGHHMCTLILLFCECHKFSEHPSRGARMRRARIFKLWQKWFPSVNKNLFLFKFCYRMR